MKHDNNDGKAQIAIAGGRTRIVWWPVDEFGRSMISKYCVEDELFLGLFVGGTTMSLRDVRGSCFDFWCFQYFFAIASLGGLGITLGLQHGRDVDSNC